MALMCRNQSIDSHYKSVDWFLYNETIDIYCINLVFLMLIWKMFWLLQMFHFHFHPRLSSVSNYQKNIHKIFVLTCSKSTTKTQENDVKYG